MPLWAVLVWLAVWQLIAWWVDAPILLVSPLTALKRLLELAFEAAFWRAVAFSVGRILLGFLLSALLGAVLAAAAYRFRRVRELLMPLVAAVKAVPVASFVILVLLWVSSRNLSVVISLLIGFPVIYANVLAGLDSTDPRLDRNGARIPRAFSPSAEHGVSVPGGSLSALRPEPGHRPVLEKRRGG